jgi:hypothetical protein
MTQQGTYIAVASTRVMSMTPSLEAGTPIGATAAVLAFLLFERRSAAITVNVLPLSVI